MIGAVSTSAFQSIGAATRTLERVAQRISNPDNGFQSYARDYAQLSMAEATYAANATVIRTADELMGTVLDIID